MRAQCRDLSPSGACDTSDAYSPNKGGGTVVKVIAGGDPLQYGAAVPPGIVPQLTGATKASQGACRLSVPVSSTKISTTYDIMSLKIDGFSDSALFTTAGRATNAAPKTCQSEQLGQSRVNHTTSIYGTSDPTCQHFSFWRSG